VGLVIGLKALDFNFRGKKTTNLRKLGNLSAGIVVKLQRHGEIPSASE
jgi:hypothetical protein